MLRHMPWTTQKVPAKDHKRKWVVSVASAIFYIINDYLSLSALQVLWLSRHGWAVHVSIAYIIGVLTQLCRCLVAASI